MTLTSHGLSGLFAVVLASSGLVAPGLIAQAGQPPGALGGWETLLNFAPQLAFGAALFFAMKYVIDNFRSDITNLVDQISKDNERRDAQNRVGLEKFEMALRSANESSQKQMEEIGRQLQLATSQDRDQNAKMFDAIFGLTREAVSKMGGLESKVGGLESKIGSFETIVRAIDQETKMGRRGSSLPPPDGGNDPRPLSRARNEDDS